MQVLRLAIELPVVGIANKLVFGERALVGINLKRIAAEAMRDELLTWLEDAGANYAAADPDFDAEQFAAVTAYRQDTLLPRKEAERLRMFEEGWRPNAGWWGSNR